MIFVMKELVKLSLPRLTTNVQPREESYVVFQICNFLLTVACSLRIRLPSILSLLLAMISSMDWVLPTKRSVIKIRNCSLNDNTIFRIFSTPNELANSFLWRAISSYLSSSKELPSSSITSTSERTSFTNASCTFAV